MVLESMAKTFIERIKEHVAVESIDNGLPSDSLFVNLKPHFIFAFEAHSGGFDSVREAWAAVRKAKRCHCERCNELEPPDDPRKYLGRGNDRIPGKPFGYSHHMERDAIRAHLRKRLWKFGLDSFASFRLESRVSEIQRRLHKNKPTLRERQAAWRAKQPKPTGANAFFTWEQLQFLAEHFAGANFPLAIEVAEKVQTLLETRE
jgi:hypothetical protein